jgi:PKD repeat protein
MKSKNKINIYFTIAIAVLMMTSWGCEYDLGFAEDNPAIDPTKLPQVSFTASKTSLFQDDSITFSHTSTGDPKFFSWEFEGGNPTVSSMPNPTVKYPIKGKFKVKLKVRNDIGANELVKTEYITVEGIPLDPAIVVKMAFEKSLLNEGSALGAATSSGTATYGAGKIGTSSYTLSGTNFLKLNDYKGINGKAPRTCAAWINTTATINTVIMHWGVAGTGSRNTFRVLPTTLRYEWQGGGVQGTKIVNDGKWHHVAFTYDGTTVKLYVDGEPDGSIAAPTLNTGVSGESPVDIGSQAGTVPLIGAIDDVYIYNRALTDAEILKLSKG